MDKIIECVPNFSEGRRVEVIEDLARVIASAGVKVLDREMDADHHRAVITFAGEPENVAEAAFRAASRAKDLIDLDQHHGEHPRIGALDVLPFVPVRGVTMDDCVQMARRAGERIGRELEIPVYLYQEAATRPERRDLAYVRRGEYETLKRIIATDPDREPDFGPRRVGKAGAMAVGARPFLIAYNVNLATNDLRLAKDIARAIRFKTPGGLPTVKALGFELADKGIVQVSMNLTDFRVTGMLTAFERVKMEADKRGVGVVESELIGLVPHDALVQIAEQKQIRDARALSTDALAQIAREALILPGLGAGQVVETRILGE